MFDLLEVSLIVLERLVPLEERIRKKSRSLAEQIAEAADSIVLNVGEGRGQRGGNQRRHYAIASGSAGEVTVALRAAVARRIITEEDRARVEEPLDRVRAMLYRILR
jgi:four helix bundle protein